VLELFTIYGLQREMIGGRIERTLLWVPGISHFRNSSKTAWLVLQGSQQKHLGFGSQRGPNGDPLRKTSVVFDNALLGANYQHSILKRHF